MTMDILDGGRIEPRELADEMRASYLDYAMSVIVGRALPDVRDGLKPVHRRVLYAMSESGLQPGRPYSKCSRVVGDVLGKYHPHGDTAVYDALVRMAQPFSLRYPLIDGQGNFGNIDGYSAAAMRYTECRLAPLATELLRDIDAETVDFMPNYDERHREPIVLPSRFPNLLVNGSSGIAVGMATNIPPHNLGETIDAVVTMIDNPAATVEDLMQHIKGPDFPTGGSIMGLAGIREAYETGRGRVRMRAKVHTEPVKGGKTALIVTELPYMVRKGGDEGVIAKLAELANSKVISELADLRDETDRTGMRIYIELKRDAIPKVVLNKIYKHTALQQTFGVNMVALVGGVPRTLSLRDVVSEYVDHQREVVTRRTKFELDRAEKRAHVLEGYLIALDNLDEVIALIRGSDDADSARTELQNRFSLTEVQAQAILDLRLRALTGLERQRIQREHADLLERIGELRSILSDDTKLMGLIKEELLEIRQRFADARRTEIVAAEGEIDLEQLIAEEDMVISITASGYIKRLPLSTYRTQGRGGVGVTGMDLKEGDYIEHLFIASTHDYVLFFTNVGKVYRVKVHELPLGARQSKGRALVNVLPLRQDEYVRAVIDTRDYGEGRYLLFATKRGVVKKTEFKSYDTVLKADGIIALRIREGDELIGVQLTKGSDEVLLVSRLGQAVRFRETDVRAMGRDASGVAGMRVADDDEVIAVAIARDDQELLVVTENGFGKRTRIEEYRKTGRGAKGVGTIRYTESRGRLAGAMVVRDGYEMMLISQEGVVIRQPVDEISLMGRLTQGVRVMRLRAGDQVSSVARVTEPSPAEVAAATPDDPGASAGIVGGDGVSLEPDMDGADGAEPGEDGLTDEG
jgi:DNA gyrase subunit A